MRKYNVSDQDLIKQYMVGNEAALETLIHRHKAKIFTTIKMYVKDQYIAEDIFQDTFIKVVNTLRKGRYNEEGKFLPWVSRIAYNLCIDHFRRVKRTPTITNSEGFDIFDIITIAEDSPEDRMMNDQSKSKVRKLIDFLPNEQKEVVILRHYFDFSFKEIAELTGVSINTALGRMRYALINLRKVVEEKNIQL